MHVFLILVFLLININKSIAQHIVNQSIHQQFTNKHLDLRLLCQKRSGRDSTNNNQRPKMQ